MIHTSIVLPCFDEIATLPWLLDRADAVLGRRRDVELIWVDNGSTDGSGALLRQRCPDLSLPWQIVHVPENRGYGHGIQQGLARARGDYVGWSHADGQIDPSDVARAIALLHGSPDPSRTYIKGRRRGRSPRARLLSLGHSAVARAALGGRGLQLEEINAPPDLFHRAWLASAGALPDDHQLEQHVFLTLQRAGARVRYLELDWRPRRGGASSWQGLRATARLSWRTARHLWQLRAQS